MSSGVRPIWPSIMRSTRSSILDGGYTVPRGGDHSVCLEAAGGRSSADETAVDFFGGDRLAAVVRRKWIAFLGGTAGSLGCRRVDHRFGTAVDGGDRGLPPGGGAPQSARRAGSVDRFWRNRFARRSIFLGGSPVGFKSAGDRNPPCRRALLVAGFDLQPVCGFAGFVPAHDRHGNAGGRPGLVSGCQPQGRMALAGSKPGSAGFLAWPGLFDRVWIDGRIHRVRVVITRRPALTGFNLCLCQSVGGDPPGELVRPRAPERAYPPGSTDHHQLGGGDQPFPAGENTGAFRSNREIDPLRRSRGFGGLKRIQDHHLLEDRKTKKHAWACPLRSFLGKKTPLMPCAAEF